MTGRHRGAGHPIGDHVPTVRESGPQRPDGYRFTVYFAGVVCLAAAVAVMVPMLLSTELEKAEASPELWRLAIVIGVLAIGETSANRWQIGPSGPVFTWSAAAIVVSLFLVSWPWLTVLAVLVVAGVRLAARRERIAADVASAAVGTTAAGLTCTLIAGGHVSDRTPIVRTCAALAGAAVVHFVWDRLATAATGNPAGMSLAEVFRRGLALDLGVLAGNTAVALLLVTAPWQGSTVVLVPFSAALLYLVYRGYVRALDERDVWQHLDRAAKETSSLDERDVAASAVKLAADVFGARMVELAVPGAGSEPIVATLGGAGAAEDIVDWVVAPMKAANGADGVLRLGFPVATRLTERQQHVLTTFVHGVSTNLRNAHLYGEMRMLADRYAREARHDPLTGLANRKFLYEHAGPELERADRDGTFVGLLLIDLDHFKEINDTLGHGAGDEVLRTVAGRLRDNLRSSDLVARLGGDEFAVLVCGLTRPELAENVARELLPLLAEPVSHEGLRLAVEGSIGVAAYPDDGTTIDDLLRRADVALYQAKRSRGDFARYRRDRDESNVDRLTLVADLSHAIAEREFILQFQPQVDLRSCKVVGAEVLTRWQHPHRGLLGPHEFISAIEHSGLMREFALHILDRAVAECASWHRDGAQAAVSVNLSARNLHDRGLPDDVARILTTHDLPAGRLLLEITETTMLSDIDAVQEVLAGLRQVGVELSVDDFGTGYSSLALLQRVAVNELKVDRSFVRAMNSSDGDAAIVRATIELAHSLGLRVVAEGVESADHVRALRELGCDLAQGWHFGRPAGTGRMRKLLGLPQATETP